MSCLSHCLSQPSLQSYTNLHLQNHPLLNSFCDTVTLRLWSILETWGLFRGHHLGVAPNWRVWKVFTLKAMCKNKKRDVQPDALKSTALVMTEFTVCQRKDFIYLFIYVSFYSLMDSRKNFRNSCGRGNTGNSSIIWVEPSWKRRDHTHNFKNTILFHLKKGLFSLYKNVIFYINVKFLFCRKKWVFYFIEKTTILFIEKYYYFIYLF